MLRTLLSPTPPVPTAVVAVKGRHTEFRNLRRRALELTEELNDRTKELAARVVPVAAAMG